MSILKVGEKVPDFTVADDGGKEFNFLREVAKGPLVVFFYPKNRSGVCTREVKGFETHAEEFRKKGAQIVGVNDAPCDEHREWARELNLSFRLLSDEGGVAAKAFGVPKTLGFIPERVTFVIGKDGRVLGWQKGMMKSDAHVEFALKTLR